jgi:hypothetical protein
VRYAPLAAFALLAGCGSAPDAGGNNATGFAGAVEAGFRKGYREKFVPSCETSFRASAPAGLDLPVAKICGCAADKMLATKSPTELMSAPSAAEAQALMAECIAKTAKR